MIMLPRIMAATTAAARDQNLVSSFAGDLSDARVLSHSGGYLNLKIIFEKLKYRVPA